MSSASTMRPTSPLSVRSISVGSQLLSLIARQPGILRVDLVDASGLSRSAIAQRVDEFVRLGLVLETPGRSVGGRPPLELAINPRLGVLLAADVGARYTWLAASDLSGTELAWDGFDMDISDGPEAVLSEVDRRFALLLAGVGRAAEDVLAIGIGVPGPVENSTGTVVRPPIMPGWNGYRVPAFFADRYAAAAIVDNDVNLAALGEYSLRAQADEHLLYVKIDTGIGCGIVSGGVLHRGAEGAAGDIGHIRVPGEADLLCTCGNVGCLEAVASGDAIARRLRALGLAHVLDARDVTRLAIEGNGLAHRAVLDASDQIGSVLASIVSFFNPNTIVIGGPLTDLNEELLAGSRTAISGRALPLATRELRVERSVDGERVGRTGARLMALDHVLSPAGLGRILSRPVP
jgi:predicted NBD/HSP70 family sugar kinase